ncbi:hypothetical protein THAOC_15504 [Thalassiosira oceanica]|uniref:Uncharacterized protein n=1 Tax=Thalassiosira oceanica TaxID=159749 RepID=K0SRZ6_THAOC|nr:hypothetical protein THAOC_15504 [Thalassiosira oceanica]|eukprot:EJK63821.1 hypothetical protein THAOC_15504 [Thalassiosira oceanica]
MSSVLAYYTLPQGFSSRFGLDQDLAWGSGYFAMTQYLIVLTVYKGFGTINDVTVNRIVANLAGIFLSLVLAAIPPGIFGSSPRELQFLLEDKKRALRDCLRLILDGSKTEHRLPQHDLAARLHRLHATAKATFIAGFSDANAYHKDAQQLKSLPILKVDPRMQVALGNAAVLGASLLSLIRLAILIVESDTELAGFAEGAEERKVLEEIVSGLDIQDDPHHISGYAIIERANDKKEHERPSVLDDNFEETYTRGISPHTMMANFSLYLMHYIMRREKMNVAHGFFGRGRAEYSQCSTLPDHLHFTNSGLFGSTYGIDGLVNKQ